MEILVNQKPYYLKRNKDLISLLEEMQIENKKGIAVAVNNSVVRRDDWGSFILKENDKITIIKATQGG